MITASFVTFRAWQMKPEYRDAVADELAQCYAPDDFHPIDAPDCMAAGSTYSYEYTISPGKFTDMPLACAREC